MDYKNIIAERDEIKREQLIQECEKKYKLGYSLPTVFSAKNESFGDNNERDISPD